MPSKRPSTCHPDRVRKTSDGLCNSCYCRRRYAENPRYKKVKQEYYQRKRDELAEQYAESVGPVPTYECAHCGAEHTPKTRHPQNRFCSRNCQDAHNKMLRRVGRSQAGGYTRQEIFDRDAWVCQLCNGNIPKTAKSPHPMSASVDHIIPLDAGGSDSPENVQATHLRCNIAKGVKPMGEQLRLVG